GKNSLNRLIRLFAGKKSAQIREILISESAWEEMTCLFAPSLKRRLDGALVFPLPDISRQVHAAFAGSRTILTLSTKRAG
ncbi:hypothetical protein, partial [Klebsiella pneumoniae]|uniref:hypothetical protein n=1 Tax=Klebsiella pneumoniae TaxID=573 RepID=UPI00115EA8C8